MVRNTLSSAPFGSLSATRTLPIPPRSHKRRVLPIPSRDTPKKLGPDRYAPSRSHQQTRQVLSVRKSSNFNFMALFSICISFFSKINSFIQQELSAKSKISLEKNSSSGRITADLVEFTD